MTVTGREKEERQEGLKLAGPGKVLFAEAGIKWRWPSTVPCDIAPAVLVLAVGPAVSGLAVAVSD